MCSTRRKIERSVCIRKNHFNVFVESLFKIVPLAQYTSKQELKDRLKRKKWNQGMTLGTMTLKVNEASFETEKDEEISHLEEYVKMEESVNTMIASQLDGKYLLYGMIIQV